MKTKSYWYILIQFVLYIMGREERQRRVGQRGVVDAVVEVWVVEVVVVDMGWSSWHLRRGGSDVVVDAGLVVVVRGVVVLDVAGSLWQRRRPRGVVVMSSSSLWRGRRGVVAVVASLCRFRGVDGPGGARCG